MNTDEKLMMEAQCEAMAKDGGLQKVRHMIDRGDPLTPELVRVAEAWLVRKTNEEKEQWLRTPEGSAVRQADAAERAAKWAGWAIAISLAALAMSGWALIAGQLVPV